MSFWAEINEYVAKERVSASFHEAGHSVVARNFGFTTTFIDVAPSRAHCKINVIDPLTGVGRIRMVAMFYAGWIAQRRAGYVCAIRGAAAKPNSDTNRIRDILAKAPDWRSELRAGRMLAHQIVERDWAQIGTLARVLNAQWQLDEAQVAIFYRYGSDYFIGPPHKRARLLWVMRLDRLRDRLRTIKPRWWGPQPDYAAKFAEQLMDPEFAAFASQRLFTSLEEMIRAKMK